MGDPVEFTIYILFSFVIILVSGVHVVRKLTLALEGKYEFKGDSISKRSRLAGFTVFFLWVMFASVNWSFAFDWFLSGSIEYAYDRLWIKVYVILEILAALGDD